MKSSDKKSKTPTLRFPEFSGEWAVKRLGDVVENIGGTALEEFASKEGGFKFISIGNYSTDGKYIDNGQRIVLNEKTRTKLLDKDNLVMVLNDKTASGDLIGSTILINEDYKYIYNQRSERLICNDKVVSHFLWIQLNTENFRMKVVAISQGGTQIYVNFPSVKKLIIELPTLPEQQRIASFLTSVDTWLETLRKQKRALEQYKKGMLQKLFPQTGAKVPELRFKGFSGEWVEKSLKDILSLVIDNRGKTPPLSKAGYPMIEANTLGRRDIDFSLVTKYVNEATFKTWFRKYLAKGDILFSTVGVTALCAYYTGQRKAVIAQNIVGLRFKSESTEFMYYLLTEKRNNHKFKRIQMGAVQPSVKVSQMIYIPFKLPTFSEQQKIAAFLTSVDIMLEAKQKQIVKAEEWKKGLLQRMFV